MDAGVCKIWIRLLGLWRDVGPGCRLVVEGLVWAGEESREEAS